MGLEELVLEFMVIMFSAVFSYVIVYLTFKKFSIAVWGYIAAFLPRAPVTFIAMTGGTNLTMFSWFSHTVGIVIYPIILVIADILLIEIALIKLVRPIQALLPKPLQTAIRIESFLRMLQDYHAVPRPERIQSVYAAGVLAGIINLMFVVAFHLI